MKVPSVDAITSLWVVPEQQRATVEKLSVLMANDGRKA
jgi:hypothetical protein